MKRLHVHVAVDGVDALAASIEFYSVLFGSEPSVVKPDYAKWMLDDPRVNFAISARGAPAGLNHMGIQVESAAELEEMRGRLEGMSGVEEELGTACCYAKSDKYWVTDPQGIAWESYHTLESVPVFGGAEADGAARDCCVPVAVQVPLSVKSKASVAAESCCSSGKTEGQCC